MLKKIIVTIVVLVFGLQVNAQEKYTDEEIGFDRTLIEKLVGINQNGEFSDLKGTIDDKVLHIRNEYVDYYLSQKDLAIPTIDVPVNDTCVNMDFTDGNFNGWCRFYDNYPTNTTGGDPFETGTGTCDANEVINDTASEIMDFTNSLRFEVLNENTFNDQFIGDGSNFPEGVTDVVRIGNSHKDFRRDQIRQTFVLSENNSVFKFNYAVVLENPNHPIEEQPYFRFYIEVNGDIVECSERLFIAGQVPDFQSVVLPRPAPFNGNTTIEFLTWQNFSLDLSSYADPEENITVVLETSDCAQGGHLGYAYFSGSCLEATNSIQTESNSGNNCAGESLTFLNDAIGTFNNETYLWTFHDSNGTVTSTEASPSYTFFAPGDYLVELQIIIDGNTACPQEFSAIIEIVPCPPSVCDDCESFKPKPKEKYVLSAWVKEEVDQQVKSYENSSVIVSYLDNSYNSLGLEYFTPKGRIIEGWQRIYKEFIIPEGTVYIEIILKNDNQQPTYFDDIRIHPFNGNMKSFVYDPITQRLMAELDENNYSTFYEYDNEGGLIRVKKETQKGIYTIQETRSKSSIKD